MKVLVADNVSPVTLDKIREAGLELIYEPTYTGDSLQQGLAEHDPTILVVRSTKVLPAMMDAAQGLELIVRAGAGTDNIDSAHASRRGIYVANCPGKNSHAVAELVMGLMLATDRRIPEGVEMLNRGRWNKGLFAGSRGLKGRTLGIIGLGNIGRLVAARA
jgi:D-3-phosphoglycerate dehydrogenase